MKTQVIIAFFTLCFLSSAPAQTDSIIPLHIYRTWVYPINKGKPVIGALYEVKDSTLVISNSLLKQDYLHDDFTVSELNIRNIKMIKVRKAGAQGAGILAGGLIGAAVGLTLGIFQHTNGGTEFDQEMQHAGLVVIPLAFTGLGIGIGAAVGGIKFEIPIKGQQKNFDRNRGKLDSWSIMKNNTASGNR